QQLPAGRRRVPGLPPAPGPACTHVRPAPSPGNRPGPDHADAAHPGWPYARGPPAGILSGSLVQVCPWTPAGRATRLTPVRTPGPATESQNTAMTPRQGEQPMTDHQASPAHAGLPAPPAAAARSHDPAGHPATGRRPADLPLAAARKKTALYAPVLVGAAAAAMLALGVPAMASPVTGQDATA